MDTYSELSNISGVFEVSETTIDKLKILDETLASMGKVLIAFSGGVDSSFLLARAKAVLGDNVLAVTIATDFFPTSELTATINFTKTMSIRHIVTQYSILQNENFVNNTTSRCYHCKLDLFTHLQSIATNENIDFICDGSNFDDIQDFRPGLIALEELNIHSPLLKAALTKAEIRDLSRQMKLSTWDKPSLACLATRVPYGTIITGEIITKISSAETYLKSHDFKQVRVRCHDDIARIELFPAEFAKITSNPEYTMTIVDEIKKFGFKFITLDLAGYISGSMNMHNHQDAFPNNTFEKNSLHTNTSLVNFANIDYKRTARNGFPETVYAKGKTPEQVALIMQSLYNDQIKQKQLNNAPVLLATKASREQYNSVIELLPHAIYHEIAKCITVGMTYINDTFKIAVVTAGTSDIPIAEEAIITLNSVGLTAIKIYDVGVAGLHRIMEQLDKLKQMDLVIVIAGMDGALPSVVGGLLACPIIAVPTSVGYGSSFEGVAPLLAMLNSCSSGVTVVNIDNGYGAAIAAYKIYRMIHDIK